MFVTPETAAAGAADELPAAPSVSIAAIAGTAASVAAMVILLIAFPLFGSFAVPPGGRSGPVSRFIPAALSGTSSVLSFMTGARSARRAPSNEQRGRPEQHVRPRVLVVSQVRERYLRGPAQSLSFLMSAYGRNA